MSLPLIPCPQILLHFPGMMLQASTVATGLLVLLCGLPRFLTIMPSLFPGIPYPAQINPGLKTFSQGPLLEEPKARQHDTKIK